MTMQQRLNGFLTRARDSFGSFTNGQKAIAVIGTAALLIAAFMVFRWASAPSYAPLYSNLSGEDASAVIEELDASGVPYEIAGGGGTIMVPRGDVYTTRIAMSGKGLPTTSGESGGYSLLDNQDLSTSEFKEQTDFKRAMEGELARTIEAIDGVQTSVVHLAIPEKEVFSDDQEPTTASVLVDTQAGATLEDEAVQSIVHLVASSISGLDPKKVTVTDSSGKVLSSDGTESGSGVATTRSKQVKAFQDQMKTEIQSVLDRVLGPGMSTTTVTADLDFDKSVTDSRRYSREGDLPPLSESRQQETYTGAGGPGAGGAGGVVGPDGQMDSNAAGAGNDSRYNNSSRTQDNPIDHVDEHRETAPGAVNTLHVGVILDSTAAANVQPEVIEDLISSAVGITPDRGDTIEVQTLPFSTAAQDALAEELAAAEAAEAKDRKNALLRNIGIGGGIVVMLLLAWVQARRRAKAREEATSYLVEQLRTDVANRAPAIETPAVAALEALDAEEDDTLRDELLALVEKQPEDVASLLRGWLVEPR